MAYQRRACLQHLDGGWLGVLRGYQVITTLMADDDSSSSASAAHPFQLPTGHGRVPLKTREQMILRLKSELAAEIAQTHEADAEEARRPPPPVGGGKRGTKRGADDSTRTRARKCVKTMIQQVENGVLEALDESLERQERSSAAATPTATEGSCNIPDPMSFFDFNNFFSGGDEEACIKAYASYCYQRELSSAWFTFGRETLNGYEGVPLPTATPKQRATLDTLAKIERFELYRTFLIMCYILTLNHAVDSERAYTSKYQVEHNQHDTLSLKYSNVLEIARKLVQMDKMTSETPKSKDKDEQDCYMCVNKMRRGSIHLVRVGDDVKGYKVCDLCESHCRVLFQLVHLRDQMGGSAREVYASMNTSSGGSARQQKQIVRLEDVRRYVDTNSKTVVNTVRTLLQNMKIYLGDYVMYLRPTKDESQARAMLQYFQPLFPPDDPRSNPMREPVDQESRAIMAKFCSSS